MEEIIKHFKDDPEYVPYMVFNNDERLKVFRSIRKSLKGNKTNWNGTFGNDFKGSSLETVITANM